MHSLAQRRKELAEVTPGLSVRGSRKRVVGGAGRELRSYEFEVAAQGDVSRASHNFHVDSRGEVFLV